MSCLLRPLTRPAKPRLLGRPSPGLAAGAFRSFRAASIAMVCSGSSSAQGIVSQRGFMASTRTGSAEGQGISDEQRAFFDANRIAPIFDQAGWCAGRPARKSTLFGLGIPPQQYDALATCRHRRHGLYPEGERLEKLACDFPLSPTIISPGRHLAGRYGEAGPLPPYLRRARTTRPCGRVRDRLTVVNALPSPTCSPPSPDASGRSLHPARRAGLDVGPPAQRYSGHEITRTAAPAARVIFRTAAEPGAFLHRPRR
jgi:hypothetical protein